MSGRAVSLLFVLAAVLLIATVEGVTGQSFNEATVAWLLAAFLVLACAAAYSAWTLVRWLWLGISVNTLDVAFWITFLILPISVWLLHAVVLNLLEWYRG